MRYKTFARLIGVIIGTTFLSAAAFAQTTEFTYQGSLKDGGAPANGNYDMEFRLFDALTGGSQLGTPTLTRANVMVTDGVFSVTLDFSGTGSAFPGADRYLQIGVKNAGGPSYTTLTPRQKISSSPYAQQSLNAATASTATNATQLGGIAASQYVLTGDTRLSDARPPTPGSTNYVQNTTSLQASTNFNISGNGTAGGTLSGNVVNTTTQYNISGNRVLGIVPIVRTIFVGGANGSTTASDNTFVGAVAGLSTTTAGANSFFGSQAGKDNTTGANNTFVGYNSGSGSTTGSSNTLLGANTAALANNLQFATAIGAGSDVLTSNTVVLGRRNGSDFVFVPGPVSMASDLFVGSGSISAGNSVSASEFRIGNRILAAPVSSNNTVLGINTDVSGGVTFATAIGSGAVASLSNSIYLGRAGGQDAVRIPGAVLIDGSLVVNTLGGAGSQTVCLNAVNRLSPCSSSLRYKTNIARFASGLDIINRLQPITFDWKDGGKHDLGLGAEDVAAVEPLLLTYNQNGQVEGVKYDRIGVVLINAVKEQQTQLTAQQQQFESQKAEIEILKAAICELNPKSVFCSK
jgi:hypothetical protein